MQEAVSRCKQTNWVNINSTEGGCSPAFFFFFFLIILAYSLTKTMAAHYFIRFLTAVQWQCPRPPSAEQ